MNTTRKSKRRKEPKKGFKTITKDGETEVFVLPPNLLQKLGINLGSIESTQEGPTVTTGKTDITDITNAPVTSLKFKKPDVIPEAPFKEEKKGDTTILETADLMKKSVFLSPTFITSGNNIDSGELEISKEIEPKRTDDVTQSTTIDAAFFNAVPKHFAVDEAFPQIDKLAVNLDLQSNAMEVGINESNLNRETDIAISNPLDSNKHVDQDNNQIRLSNIAITDISEKRIEVGSPDDHPDEAYLSDCSNSTSGPSDNAGPTLNYIPEIHSTDFEMPKVCQNKVTILSEEIISPSKFRDLQIMLSPKKSNFIPVSMNCVVTSNNFCDNIHYDINTVENLKNIYEEHKDLDYVVLYDEGGNVMTNVNNNISADTVNSAIQIKNSGNFDLITDAKVESLTQSSEADLITKAAKLVTHAPETSFEDIDLVVIDMEIEENEASLENFVKEIASNDDNILKKIEQSEKYCSPIKNDRKPEMLYINAAPKIDLGSIQPESILDICEKKKKVHEGSLSVNNTLTGLESSTTEQLPKVCKQAEDKDEVLQVFEIVTNCNEIQTDIETINDEQDKYKNIKNIEHNFEEQMIDFKATEYIPKNITQTECVDNVTKEHPCPKYVATSNSDLIKDIYLKCVQKYATSMITNSRELKSYKSNSDESENLDNDFNKMMNKADECVPNNEHTSISVVLVDSGKETGNTDESSQLIETEIRVTPKELNEHAVCVPINNITTVKVKTNKQETNASAGANLNNKNKEPGHNVSDKKFRDESNNNLNNKVKEPDNNVSDEKIREIAMYLSQFAKAHNKSARLRRKSIKNLEILSKRSKESALTSKLYIQGVEKPGGSVKSDENYKINKVVKTYSRPERPQKRPISVPLAVTSTKHLEDCCIADYEKDTVSTIVRESTQTPEFCLCGDFGRLTYYDSSHPYEHIHFWEHKFVHCDHECVFGIYNDIINFNTEIKEVSDLIEDVEQSADTVVHNICWHSCKKVPDTKQNNKTLNTAEDKIEGEVLSDLSKSNEQNQTIQSVQNYVHMSLNVDCKFRPESTTTVSQENTMHKSDSNTMTVPKEISVKNNDSDKQNDLPHNKLIKEAINTENEDTASPKSVTKENVAKKNKSVEKVVPTKENRDTDVKNKKKFKSSKNFDSMANLDQNAAIIEKIQPADENITEKGASGESSKVKANVSEIVDNLKCVDKQHAIVEGDNSRQPSDQVALDIRTENIDDKMKAKKRRNSEKVEDEEPPSKKSVKCDVCKKVIAKDEWDSHVSAEHCFIAWKSGTVFNFKKPLLLKKVQERVNSGSKLKCTFCNAELKHPTKFITHVQRCFSNLEASPSPSDSSANESAYDSNSADLTADNNSVISCGVCKEIISDADWIEHIKTKHDYIAWKEGESPLNVTSECDVRIHLFNTIRIIGELVCTKCGISWRYPKPFLDHIKSCTGSEMPQKILEESTVENLITGHVSEHVPDVKCAVCSKSMPNSEWIQHILEEHDYLAWKEGEQPLDMNDESAVWSHLLDISKQNEGLVCNKCGLVRKYPKSYKSHIERCTGKLEVSESLNQSTVEEPRNPNDEVTCAVCSKSMLESEWVQHIVKNHGYLAWREGDRPLDLENPDAVHMHLYNICKKSDGLTCNKCGLVRKRAKWYLQHIGICQGPVDAALAQKPAFQNPLIKDSAPCTTILKTENDSELRGEADGASNSMVICGVCGKEVWSEKWISHIGRAHNYMAWKVGEKFDINNEEAVYNRLYEVIKKVGYLACAKCGVVRKYAKTFIHHVKSCNADAPTTDYDEGEAETDGKLVCAVCSEEVSPKKWKHHKMENHYNVAWTVGSIPVDTKNANVVDSLMKEYMEKYKKMVCKVCNATRVSRVGFYAHVIQCGKTEEEIDAQKTTCNICNKKYLYIYHNQHMTWHNQQEIIKERKLRAAEEEQERKQKVMVIKQEPGEEVTPGRRRAAEKARNIIEKFKKDEFLYNCPNCKFGADSKEELANHSVNCKGNDAEEAVSDSEESAHLDDYSEAEDEDENDESEGSAVDSNESEEETLDTTKKKKWKKKKFPAYTSIMRFPHVPKNLHAFLKKVGTEFHEQHFIYESLFPDFRSFDCEPVPDDRLSEYLPPLEESCKVQFCDDQWISYKRFQAERRQCLVGKYFSPVYCQIIFTGSYIQCVSWAPPGPDKDNSGGNYLAVACHRGPDVTRIRVDEVATHAGLIQLWSFGDFSQVAELVFGLAHDYGAVWAMDWCPSGARDVLLEEPEAGKVLRLGLLAVAFSNGCALVFSVPHPSTLLKREKIVQRLKPVAELRLTMNPDRKIYQATSIKWSSQKPNESIVVGYADGTTAYFDLNTDSPFLKTVEDNVMIFYPYYDERVHSNCITGVGLYPSVGVVGPAGAACCSSPTGVALLARPGVRPARQHYNSAVGGAQFEPLWPCAALVGDDANITSSVNEIEWYGGGRRMGGGSAGAGCECCGRYVLAALPLLRVRYPHPADNAAKKQIVGVLQMTPLANKRKKLQNDDLQTKVEPTTYEDAIQKYGLELRMDKDTLKKAASKPREMYPERNPERFPLGDVTSMAFCLERAHHQQLAVATHSGMLFVLPV